MALLKSLICTVAIAVLLAAFAWHQHGRITELETTVARQETTLDVLADIVQKTEAIHEDYAERSIALEKAIQDASEWSSCGLPDDVVRCVCDGETDASRTAVRTLSPIEDLR